MAANKDSLRVDRVCKPIRQWCVVAKRCINTHTKIALSIALVGDIVHIVS
jgi:hypothetical protein